MIHWFNLIIQKILNQISCIVGNPEPRRHINKLLYFRIVIGFVEFFIWCWNLTGLIQPELIYPETSNSTSSCSIHASIQIIFITYSSIEFLLTLFLLFLTYDSMGRSNMYSYKKDENYYFKRLRFLFCCTRLSSNVDQSDEDDTNLINSKSEILRSASKMFATVLQGNNMVTTDWLCALKLENQQQMQSSDLKYHISELVSRGRPIKN